MSWPDLQSTCKNSLNLKFWNQRTIDIKNRNVGFYELTAHPLEMSTNGGCAARRCQNGKWNFVTLSLSFTHTAKVRHHTITSARVCLIRQTDRASVRLFWWIRAYVCLEFVSALQCTYVEASVFDRLESRLLEQLKLSEWTETADSFLANENSRF